MSIDVNILIISSAAGFTAAGVDTLRTWPMIESVHAEPSEDGRFRELTVVTASAQDREWLARSIAEFDAREAMS